MAVGSPPDESIWISGALPSEGSAHEGGWPGDGGGIGLDDHGGDRDDGSITTNLFGHSSLPPGEGSREEAGLIDEIVGAGVPVSISMAMSMAMTMTTRGDAAAPRGSSAGGGPVQTLTTAEVFNTLYDEVGASEAELRGSWETGVPKADRYRSLPNSLRQNMQAAIAAHHADRPKLVLTNRKGDVMAANSTEWKKRYANWANMRFFPKRTPAWKHGEGRRCMKAGGGALKVAAKRAARGEAARCEALRCEAVRRERGCG